MHLVAYHFWRGLAALAEALYARRREPSMWLIGFIVLEMVAFWIVWGALLRVF